MAAAVEDDEKAAGGATRRLRRLLLLPARKDATPPDQDHPFLVSTLPSASGNGRKGGFASAALLRSLGCTSASSARAYAPPPPSSTAAAVVRASADWQTRRPRWRRKSGKAPRKKDRDRHPHYAPPLPPRPLHSRRNLLMTADMWCATGIAIASAADDSVDCVVPSYYRHWAPVEGRGGRVPVGVRAQRERSCIARREGGHHLEQLSSLMDSHPPSILEMLPIESDLMLPGHRCQLRRFHASRGGLREIMMFQSRLLLAGMDVYDRHRDWRLDVDHMSYEELLELSDKIGYVNTGLREEEIFRCLTKKKHSVFCGSLLEFSTEMEWTCSICQEEYMINDEMGKLECGHCFHMNCIREWLLQKNVCPVCKIAAARS